MKIAYLSTFYPFRGGIAQFNENLLTELAKSNEVKAFTFTTQYPDFLFPGKSQFVDGSVPAPSDIPNRILSTVNPITYFTTAVKLNNFAPEMMLCKFWIPFLSLSLGTAARLLKRKTVKIAILDNVVPHEKRIGDNALIRYFLNTYDGFVVMSNAVRDDLLKFKPNAEYIHVPHPLYDHFGERYAKRDAREKAGIPSDKKVLLFFGFIRRYKGLDLLIEAFAKLSEEYHLIIAGEPYEPYSDYSDLIERLNVGDRVTQMIRFIGDDDVRLLFSASDVCVLPYRSATQSGIVGISYHFDLPIIATDVGGLSEMIEPYGTGIMTEASPDAIADAIVRYYESDTDEFAENIKMYKLSANWSNLAQKIIEFYNQIVKNRH